MVSPERTAFEGEVTSVSLRSAGGDIGFLAGHVPFIGSVRVSVCDIEMEGATHKAFALHGGFVEVDPDGRVTVLADVVEGADEIDVERARAARDRALSARSAGGEADAEIEGALARAEVRLSVAGA